MDNHLLSFIFIDDLSHGFNEQIIPKRASNFKLIQILSFL